MYMCTYTLLRINFVKVSSSGVSSLFVFIQVPYEHDGRKCVGKVLFVAFLPVTNLIYTQNKTSQEQSLSMSVCVCVQP